MEFKEWYEGRIREAATIVCLLILTTFVVFAILHRVAPAGVLYKFLYDLFHQVQFYVGGVLALLEMFMLKMLDTPLGKKLFTGLALFFIFVASFQAWVDEHKNSEQLAKDKSAIAGELEFWKGQSYAKDDTVREQTSLLSQQVTTAQQMQGSYDQLVNKMLTLTKPERPKIIGYRLGIPSDTSIVPGRTERFIVVTDRVISPIRLEITCNQPIVSASGLPLGSNTSSFHSLGRISRNLQVWDWLSVSSMGAIKPDVRDS